MQNEEIVTKLSQLSPPDEVIYVITMEDVLVAITNRLGEDEALKLTENDLKLARDEIRAAIDHDLDIRDYIDLGLDAWEITRNL